MRASSIALLVLAMPLGAQDTTTKLPPVVTVTRAPARSPMDLPFGITTVSPDSLRPGQAHVAADQALAMIPGITVANRTNPSQDPRVSVRGFGARSAFGVRSIRIVRDGMPLTLPDGQTPLDYLDLESIGRIEVIRGTASALYGNATGGVIDLRSVAPTPGFTPEARVWFGSDALQRATAVASGVSGRWSYQGNVGQTRSDNYRKFSRQELTNGFGRIATTIRGAEVSLVGLGLHMPVAENPGALTRAQNDTNPEMADPLSITRKARKEVDQLQLGLAANRSFGRVALSAAVYGGTRSLFNPLTFAVVDVQRALSGASLRGDVDLPYEGLRLTIGGDYQVQDDDRKNWANCNGVTAPSANCPAPLGAEKGVLQLDQQEIVTGGGPYAQLQLERGPFRVNAGVRADAIRFELQDRFLTDTRDDSGVRTLRATSPMAGVAWRVSRTTSLYANYTTAFETPTTTELVNKADGSPGLNPDLLPQFSRTVEAGAKGVASVFIYEISAFRTRVRDELIAFQLPSGRAFFDNAGQTTRDGLEGGLAAYLGPVEASVTHSFSSFRFREFMSGTTDVGGKRIPGIPLHQTQLSLTARFASGGFALMEGVAKSRVWANDANTDLAYADAFATFNVRAGRDFRFGSVRVAPVVGVNNVLDEKYVGSVAVNAAGTIATAKLFEPAPGRTWITGARLWYRQ